MTTAKALKIGFTGTQDGMKVKQLRCVGQAVLCHCLIEYLPLEFHHGDCTGADEQAHKLARALLFKVFVHPPDDDSRRAFCKVGSPAQLADPKPYLMRNKDIVDQTAILIAAPKGEEEKRSGTWATVRYARKLGRPIYICWPDGRLTFENVPAQQAKYAEKGRSKVPVAEALQKSLEEPPLLYCSVCGSMQLVERTGRITCKNDHGGVESIRDPVTASGVRAKWRGERERERMGL